MKVKVFENNEWREADGYDFDDFVSDVVYSELPFVFTDCTNEEIEEFVGYLNEESTGLDDGEYQCWYCEANTADMPYVFENMNCKTLPLVLAEAERTLKEYKKCMENLYKIKG